MVVGHIAPAICEAAGPLALSILAPGFGSYS
jgi:hypothetical protein